jgi:phosphatidylglycerophosphatase C
MRDGSVSVVAAFDVDGTLTVRDCVRPFLETLAGRSGVAVAALRRPAATLSGLARRDRDRLKDVIVGGVFHGRWVTEVDEAGHEFAGRVEATMLRADTVARLRWHQDSGHRTVLVSASLRPYLEPLARSLGLDGVLCTEVASVEGRYTDRLLGSNCRADEKWKRLSRWMADEGLADAQLWAYGDSAGDRAMLAHAHRPTWVRGTTVSAVPSETTS